MAAKKKSSIAQESMHFITRVTPLNKDGVRLQSDKNGSALVKKVGEVKKDYEAIVTQINFIMADTDAQVKDSGFSLDEVKISLGFSAKGKIAFIAEAGMEASIEISFKRK
jgi:hypothetical protein